ncbi:MAG: diguanylate cyclase [Magnetococcales bacterium]|nr:diguanylate cyclase [Magnetococcales bacterium]
MTSITADKKILIVDDVPGNIKALSAILEDDYKIIIATSGKSALKIVLSQTIDLILLDVKMPEMDGYEVCEKLKADRATAGIPVIFVTAQKEEVNETRGLNIGAVDYITKPARPAILKLRVKIHLELKKQRDLLQELSDKDGLTGIPNRRKFDEYLKQTWYSAIRSQSPISIILMDVDYFKHYNDNYGHTSGDKCLKQIARALIDSKRRPSDFMARYGGEEFVCVLQDTDTVGVNTVGEMIRNNVASLQIPHAHSMVADHITFSLGAVSLIPSLDSTPEDVIKVADENLYKAKEGGRNRLVCHSIKPAEYKILLVEDEATLMDVYSSNIEEWKLPAKIIKATNGVEGLLQVGNEKPDIIITDLMMPELDGIKMIHKLSKIDTYNNMHIIAVTSLDHESIKQKGGLPKKVHVFKKPVSLQDLEKKLLDITGGVNQPL